MEDSNVGNVVLKFRNRFYGIKDYVSKINRFGLNIYRGLGRRREVENLELVSGKMYLLPCFVIFLFFFFLLTPTRTGRKQDSKK